MDYVNRLLMLGLVVTFMALIIFLTPHVEKKSLSHVDWSLIFMGTSIVATSFGFHIVIPTLTTYLGRDTQQLKKAILIGSAIPLVVYVIWQFVTLGILPLPILEEGYKEGANGAHLLTKVLGNSAIATL